MKHKLLFGVVLFLLAPYCLADSTATKKPLYWIDPMEPSIHYDRPGKSRMGMDVVPVYADDNTTSNTDPIVKISPAIINNLGVRTAKVTQGTLARRIKTVGYADANENVISHVHTYVDGWVKHLAVKAAGESVKKGQLLLQLYSPTLVSAQEEYLIALDSHNADVIEASRKRLQALGVSDDQIKQLKTTRKANPLINVHAPQNGIISQLNIREGMRVTPDTEVMALTDLSTIWMMAEIYESQVPWIKVGQPAEARLPYWPNRVWRGKVDYVYPQVDSVTRTLKVRLQFANHDSFLKPNMYADVSLLAAPVNNVISIPQEALIRTSEGDRVIMALGEGRFEPRAVTVGMESGDRIAIVSGLKPGETVVTSAQFLIDSEANLRGSLERLRNTSANEVKTNTQEKPITAIVGQGIVNAIQKDAHTVTLQHQPIPALNWPAMTMRFPVVKTVNLNTLKIGDAIHFTLQPSADGQFMINTIQVITKP